MRDKLIKILIPFCLIIIFDSFFYLDIFMNFGVFTPHVGVLFFSGLIFGPYGALGAAIGNIFLDYYVGYTPIEILPSAIASFGVSLLAYKIWYSGFMRKHEVNPPILDNSYHLKLFLFSIFICGFLYAAVHSGLSFILIQDYEFAKFSGLEYFLNFINVAFIFGIIAIWLSKRFNFVHTPKKSKRQVNHKLYEILFVSMLISAVGILISPYLNSEIGTIITISVSMVLLFAYLTKPFEFDITPIRYSSITEKVTTIFLFATLIICVTGICLSFYAGDVNSMINFEGFGDDLMVMPLLVITDIIVLLFFIPGLFIVYYIERNVINPISSFSEIERFIHKNQRIEAEGLIDVYSDYIHNDDEIGMLARSYTDLIDHNNNYIENIQEIEGEKERIKAELDIATRIQAANLPTEILVGDGFTVEGYSHPAKEVGGDFFDYYMLDEDNLAIVIGDVSGKGVPAAILAMITQVLTKQFVKKEFDPSKVLYSLNNQLNENNPELMFVTLWLGVYNTATKKLTFSNAGHNPPLIKDNNGFGYLNIDSGLVLGVMKDFDYMAEEIALTGGMVLYTDGMTDAINNKDEMYGEDRLLEFFNEFESDADPIALLLEDIHEFTGDAEQFDDMTTVYLKIQ